MRYKEVVPLLIEGKAARIKGWKNKKRIRIFYSFKDNEEELYLFKMIGTIPYWEKYRQPLYPNGTAGRRQ